MALPLPMPITFAPGGGTSGAQSSAGVQTNNANPFNFDNSGWVVNLNSNGASISAQGGTGANDTSQLPAGGGGAMGLPISPLYLMLAGAAYFLLKR